MPDDVGTGSPGLEERLHTALATSSGRAAHRRWASPLEEVGFADITEQMMALEVSSPTALIRRFAAAYLTRIGPAVTGRLSAADCRGLPSPALIGSSPNQERPT
ncbi:MAG: hypothetical protein ACR2M5_14260 [Nakamurella sp.]